VKRRRSSAGVTLIELLVAVTLFALLSVAMLYAFRIGLMAYSKTQNKLMDNRRVAGAQRILLQEIQNLVPVVAPCGNGGIGKGAFFQGDQQHMRLVSTFSLQGASRGVPQILEIFVSPMESGEGVRLLVNEIPYTGPIAAAQLCNSAGYNAVSGEGKSFVLADHLAFCRFTYQHIPLEVVPEIVWLPRFPPGFWPRAVRIEMAPMQADPSRLQPISVTAIIRVHRNPEVDYGDF
jgi:prepilin-type N-terminal cleavage/methylation domain-containing protein